MKDIKVAHCGNTANNAYIYVKQMRRKGYDVDLLLDKFEHVMSLPQWEDGDFEVSGIRTALKGLTVDDVIDIVGKEKWGDAPEWVKYIGNGVRKRLRAPSTIIEDIRDYGPTGLYRFSRTSSLKDPFLSLDWIKAMKQYDVLHVWGRPIAFAPSSEKPYVVTPIGGDIMGACGEVQIPNAVKEKYIKGFGHAKYVIFHDPGFFTFLKRMGLDNGIIIPFPVDVVKYAPKESELKNKLMEEYNCDMILYNPARQDWYWKGSDKMIEAFARFVKENDNQILLLLAEWGVDLERTQQLISKRGLKKYVDFLPAFTKSRLVKYYNASDIVLDTFNHTNFSFITFGTSTLEALACGKPVITDYVPEKMQEDYPGEIPVRSAKSTSQIYERLVELQDTNRRADLGRKSREWILKYFNGEKLVDRFMEVYEKALS